MPGPTPAWTETERAAELARYEILDTPREKDFDDIAGLAAEICGTPIAVVNLVSTDRQFFKAEVGLGVRSTPIETSFCAHALLAEDFLLVPDATTDPRFKCNPLVVGDPQVRFYAGALLKSPQGLPIGTMCVLDYQPRTLDDHQIRILKLLARQAMVQLELRRSLAEGAAALAVARRLEDDLRTAVQRQSDIVREMSHRMKNSLAMVQAIVLQTLKQVDTVAEGSMAIEARLAALSRAQDVLVCADADEVDIHAVAENALAPHRGGTGQIAISGPGLILTAQQGLGLSLALHELATNAVKFGALTSASGRVALSWADDGKRLTLEWRETGGPPVVPPTRAGFGTRLLDRIVPAYFRGHSALEYTPAGFAFRLDGLSRPAPHAAPAAG